MVASDGAFDAAQEMVSATFAAPSIPGDITLCVRGSDSLSNLGVEECTSLIVLDNNFITNGSFEINADGDRIPDGWTATGFQYIDGQNCGVAHTGSCSAVMWGGYRFKSLTQQTSANGSAGDALTLSLWAKANRTDRGPAALVWVTILYTNGSRRYFGLQLPGGSYDWKQLDLSFTAKRNYESIKVSIIRWGRHGRLWLDDVRIVKD